MMPSTDSPQAVLFFLLDVSDGKAIDVPALLTSHDLSHLPPAPSYTYHGERLEDISKALRYNCSSRRRSIHT